MDVPNRTGRDPRTLRVKITLNGIKSFHPDSIVSNVPALNELRQIRDLVVQLGKGKLSYEAFRTDMARFPAGARIINQMQEAPSSGQPPTEFPRTERTRRALEKPFPEVEEKEKSLGSLLEMVDMPKQTLPPSRPLKGGASAMIDDLISLVTSTGKSGVPVDRQLVNRVVSDLDATLSEQMNAILHHPEFRRLEAAWRGLKFLLDRTDFREPIRMELLSIPREELEQAFESRVYQVETQGAVETPASVIIADYSFDRSLQDVELLQRLSRKVEELQVPFIASVAPGLFGLDSFEDFDELPSLNTFFQQPEFIKWASYRKTGSSRWVGLLLNRFLLRIPYGTDGMRVRTFAFFESTSGLSDYLWGNPVWALASLLTAAFAKTGSCVPIGQGVVEDLPLREGENPAKQRTRIPLELFLSDEQQMDLSANGVIPLTCRLNSDVARILSLPSTHLPERYADAEETANSRIRASLPYQILAGQLSRQVSRAADDMASSLSPKEVEHLFTESLRSFFRHTGEIPADALWVRVEENAKHPDCYDISLRILPDRAGLKIPAPVELEFQLRK
jgi:type VI secretion system protein ImpC